MELRPFTSPAVKLVATGVELVVPFPSSPVELSPHAHTVPSDLSAKLLVAPAAKATMPENCDPLYITGTGINLEARLESPLPSCPAALPPHAHTLPLLSSARL